VILGLMAYLSRGRISVRLVYSGKQYSGSIMGIYEKESRRVMNDALGPQVGRCRDSTYFVSVDSSFRG
jgi:hypothetical protein